MKFSPNWFLLPILCAATIALRTEANEVLFSDDFESDTAGFYPDTADLDPVIGEGDVGGLWEAEESREWYVQVLCDDPVYSSAPGDNNYLQVYNPGGARAWASAMGWDRSVTENQVLKSSCSVYIPSGNQKNMMIFGWDGQPAPWGDGLRAFSVYFVPGGTLRSYHGSGWNYITSIGYNEDEWFDVSILADMSTATFELTVDGQTATESLYWTSGATQVDRVQFYSSEVTTGFFDNVMVESFSSIELPGDLNEDGFVGGDDLDIVRSFWGQTVPAGDLLSGDPSGDGFVGGDDLDIVRANWGQGTPPVPSSVPEPTMTTLILIGLGGVFVAFRFSRV